jgi:uncharacterized membrane protein
MSFLPINLIIVATLIVIIVAWSHRSTREPSLKDNLLGYGVLAFAVGATINSFFTNWGVLFVVIAVITTLACLALHRRSVNWIALVLVLFFGMVIGAWLRDVSLWLVVVINLVIAALIYFGVIEKAKPSAEIK